MTDADIEEFLRPGSDRHVTPEGHRRQIIAQLVTTLSELIPELNDQDERSQVSIRRLIAIFQSMTGSIAMADDVTFSAIMREAALLVRALRDRQADFSKFAIH